MASTEPEILAEIPKNDRESIRVTKDVYKGKDYIDVRVYYFDAQRELKPTRKGVKLVPEVWKAVREALNTMTL
jgi:hypothetical protein